MSQRFAQYVADTDKRWDELSRLAYGRTDKIFEIIQANPGVPVDDFIPAGTRLRIPIIAGITQESNLLLPPWKR